MIDELHRTSGRSRPASPLRSQTADSRRPLKRRGSLLAEVGIATVVLMMVMGLMVKMLSTIARERRAAEQRQRGVFEVANLMERITARPFDEVTPLAARKISLSDAARASLRDSELAIDVSAGENSAVAGRSAKRVMIRLRWRGPSGEWQAPVRLTSWIESRRTGL
jgi:Tfp pilus assembly protein PilV